MSIYLKLIDHDEQYRNLKRDVLMVNDLSDISEHELKTLRQKISVTYDSELMNSVSACECGHLMGEWKVGKLCPQCHTKVAPPIEQDFESILWLRTPNGIRSLMSPHVMTMLSKRFTKSGWNLIHWLTDSRYDTGNRPIAETQQLLDLGIRREWNWFHDNFDQLMDTLFELPGLKRKPSHPNYRESEELRSVLRQYRHCVFPQHLPLPNRSLLIIENTSVGTYSNNENIGAIDAIQSMSGIDSELCTLSQRDRENRTARGLAGLSKYYEDFYKFTVEDKPGIARKHLFGVRCHFSFRNVITSLRGAHDHDEIHIPWGVATTTLEYHVYNKLFQQKWSINEMLGLMNKYAHEYSPFIDGIFDELIKESPYKGLPTTMVRNPSLQRGSLQLLFGTHIKKDPNDPTVSISDLISAPLGSDFDGDATNFTLLVDNKMAEGYMDLRPYKSGLDLEEPRKLSRNLIQTKPVIAMTANYFHHLHHEPLTTQQESFMQSLAKE